MIIPVAILFTVYFIRYVEVGGSVHADGFCCYPAAIVRQKENHVSALSTLAVSNCRQCASSGRGEGSSAPVSFSPTPPFQ